MACILYYGFPNYEKAYRDAAHNFKEAMETSPPDTVYLLLPEHLHTYGSVLKKLGENTPEGSEFFSKAIHLFDTAVRIYQEKQFKYLAECNADIAGVYEKITDYENADKAYKRSIDYYKKEKLFNLSSDIHVKDAECLMEWYEKSGDDRCYERARIECNEAIRLDNSNHAAFHTKGNTYYNLGLDADAIPEYEKAVEINFDLKYAHYNLGLCYMNTGKLEDAAAKFVTTLKLDKEKEYADPENQNKPDPYQHLVFCLEKLGQMDKTLVILRNAANMFPHSIKYHLLLGQFLAKCNQLDEAAKEFRFCISFDNDNKQRLKHLALNSLADLYAESGVALSDAHAMFLQAHAICKSHLKSASETKQALSSIQEDLSSIWNTAGWIFYQKGQIRKAIVFLEKSLIDSLGNPKPHARLAYAYEKYARMTSGVTGYFEKAANQWRTVLDLDSRGNWNDIAKERIASLSV